MSLAATKNVYGTFSNDTEWVQVIYDFDVDAGATGDYDVWTAKEDVVVLDFYYDVQAACTSAGSMVMDLGVADGGTDFLSNTTVSTLNTINTVNGMGTAAPVKVAADSAVVMSIDVATLTAGKIAFNFLVKKV